MNIGRPEEFPSNVLNTRRLRTRAIPVSLPVVPSRSTSVPLERKDWLNRLAADEESDLKFINLTRNWLTEKMSILS